MPRALAWLVLSNGFVHPITEGPYSFTQGPALPSDDPNPSHPTTCLPALPPSPPPLEGGR